MLKKVFKTISVWFTWLLLRACGIELLRSEVRNREYEAKNETPLTSVASQNPSVIMQFAKELYSAQEDRSKLLFEKSKNLLTVSTLMVALLSAFPVQQLPSWLRLLPLVFVVVTVVLVLISYGLNNVRVPDLSADKLISTTLETDIAHDYYVCAWHYSYSLDFLADVYRAARRSFLTAILSLLVLTIIAAMGYKQPDTHKADSSKTTPLLLPWWDGFQKNEVVNRSLIPSSNDSLRDSTKHNHSLNR